MSRYRFELAQADDDADLRCVLAQTPMQGRISLTFLREPSYFESSVVHGRFRQVVAARDAQSGRIVGFGSRAVSRRYVNGRPEAVGYLSTLRLLPEHRKRGLVARGYKFFHDLHEDGRTALYLTTIAEGNTAALETLTSQRAGLPTYHFVGLYHTLLVPLCGKRLAARDDGLAIRPATFDDVPQIVDFLSRVGPRRQFFPCYEGEDLFAASGVLAHLRPADLLLAFRNQELVGTLGAWDQRAFRQTVVHAYHGALRFARPIYNLWARAAGAAVLPPRDGSLEHLVGALPVVVNDDPAVLTALLAAHQSRNNTANHLLLGLHESDPLLAALPPQRWKRYTTRMYLVCWPDGARLLEALDRRSPYLELGCL